MKIKSDLEVLRSLAADFHSDGHAKTATYIRNSASDIMHLQANVERLVHDLRTLKSALSLVEVIISKDCVV